MLTTHEIVTLGAIPAGVSVLVTLVAISASRLRQIRLRRRRLESPDHVEISVTAAAAIDAAASSLKKMMEAFPGTTTAHTGRSAAVAVDTASRAILAILGDLPTRLQRLEQDTRHLGAESAEMRELFNRLGK